MPRRIPHAQRVRRRSRSLRPNLLEEAFELNMQLEEMRMARKMGEDDPSTRADLGAARTKFTAMSAIRTPRGSSSCGFKVRARGRIVLAHLAGHAHLFQLHVELEGLFEKIGRSDLLLLRARCACGIRRGTRLLLQLNPFKSKQIFASRDGVAQGTIGVVQL